MQDQHIKDILTSVKTIALVGASDKPDRPGNFVMAFLQSHGYRVIPVNPRLAGKTVHGEPVHSTLEEITTPVDMVDVFLRPTLIEPIAQSAVNIGAKVFWTQKGVVNEQANEIAAKAGLKVVFDRCPKEEIPRLVPGKD
ncbi:MAG: hypothetical protein CSA52_03150 [Gammaproteobacteria bacterium]|nr:MAG: hypothetical protein CSB48_03880 [Pseudomonadota bacterium]PIE38250.1 MAG: hypothetical protein CSA52_03150 [Gammaproteobacteria bacterium]